MVLVRAVVMASGFSERFGRNKLEYVLDGERVIDRVLNVIPADFAPVVVTRYDFVKRAALERGFTVVDNGLPYLRDTVLLGLEAVGECAGVMFTVADQPWITRETLCKLRGVFALDQRFIVRPRASGIPGNPVIFPASLFGELKNLAPDESGSAVIKRHAELVRFVETDEKELRDIDYPNDL